MPKFEWPHKCSAVMIARAFGVTPQAVGLWGCPKNHDGTHDIKAIIQFRLDNAVAAAVEKMPGLGGEAGKDAQARKWAAEASLKELELGEALGSFVRLSDVESQVARAIVTLKQTIEGWPVTLAPKLADRDAGQIRDELKIAVEDALKQVSSDLQKAGMEPEEESEGE